jgi:hypothetical protein
MTVSIWSSSVSIWHILSLLATLLHFLPQPEPPSSLKLTETTKRIPQKAKSAYVKPESGRVHPLLRARPETFLSQELRYTTRRIPQKELALNSVSDLVSKVWYRIPFDQSELPISEIPPTDWPKVRPGRHPSVNRPSASRR